MVQIWQLKYHIAQTILNHIFHIHMNLIRNLYNRLKARLMNIFNLSLTTGIFPDNILIYWSISVLPCFSKIWN